MNRLLVFLFICIGLFQIDYAQKAISLKTDDKISVHGFSYWSAAEISGKDTSFSYALHSHNQDLLPSLKPGTYQINLLSVFNTRVHQTLLVDAKTDQVRFKGLEKKFHKLAKTENLCDKLKLNDTLFIISNSLNDPENKTKLGITKTIYGYTALLFEGISNQIFSTMQFKNDLYTQVTDFEKSGKKASVKGALATEACSIELKGELLSFTTTKWAGMEKLRLILFAVQR